MMRILLMPHRIIYWLRELVTEKVLGKHMNIDVFATGDNLFDVKYSLGNDINAFGERFYNAAPGVNYSAGISVRYTW